MEKRLQWFWLIGAILVMAPISSLAAMPSRGGPDVPVGSAPAEAVDLNKLYSPRISGDTLVITGRIDSHIHDFLSQEANSIEKISKIELNSLGGNMHWALDVAKKIKLLGKTTVVPKGNFCASACVYLFAAGKERVADAAAWFGVHGARLGPIYAIQFKKQCFVELENESSFEPRLKGCQAFLDSWYGLTMKATAEAFDFMEANGISADLRKSYLALPDDEKWFEHANVFRKPDWYLNAQDALKLNLVTRTLE